MAVWGLNGDPAVAKAWLSARIPDDQTEPSTRYTNSTSDGGRHGGNYPDRDVSFGKRGKPAVARDDTTGHSQLHPDPESLPRRSDRRD